MQPLFSGLSEQASRAYVGASFDDAFTVEWISAAQFMTEVDLSAAGARQRVWFYRAPWALLADGDYTDVKAALLQWQTEQRAVLQLRRTLRQRLILVNIDRVPAHALFARLGLAYYDEPLFIPTDPVASAFAVFFEQMAPEYWTLYEALESTAWLPEGAPESRANRSLPTIADLGELLDLVRAGRQFFNAQLQLRDREKTITSLRHEAELVRTAQQNRHNEQEEMQEQLSRALQELEEHKAARHSVEQENALLRYQVAQAVTDKQQAKTILSVNHADSNRLIEENSLLLTQLQQVQEELEKRSHLSLALEQKVTSLNQQLNIQATQELAKQETAANDKAHSYKQESELLLTQLHQVQDELEKRHLRSLAFEDECSDLKKQLNQALTTQQQLELDQAAASASEIALGHENELLLSQLHLVQEELESYYLANHEILAAMEQSQNTIYRARNVISRVAANV